MVGSHQFVFSFRKALKKSNHYYRIHTHGLKKKMKKTHFKDTPFFSNKSHLQACDWTTSQQIKSHTLLYLQASIGRHPDQSDNCRLDYFQIFAGLRLDNIPTNQIILKVEVTDDIHLDYATVNINVKVEIDRKMDK